MPSQAEGPFVFIHGSIGDGFHVCGPFAEHEAAENYAASHDQSAWWILPIRQVTRESNNSHCILVGNLTEGWIVIGFFDDFDAADEFTTRHTFEHMTWVMPVEEPEE